MPTIRLHLAALCLIAGWGTAHAQPSSTSGATTTRPAAAAASKGACLIVHGNGRQDCARGTDAGGCTALGLESRARTTFKPGEDCP